MAPQRPRILEESKLEVAGTKERQTSVLLHKPRRNGSLAITSRSSHSKDITQAPPTTMALDAEHGVNPEQQEVSGTVRWHLVPLPTIGLLSIPSFTPDELAWIGALRPTSLPPGSSLKHSLSIQLLIQSKNPLPPRNWVGLTHNGAA